MANLPLVLDDTTRKIKTLPSFPGGGAVQHVATVTVAGSDVTAITVSGLDLSVDQKYLVDFSWNNPTGSLSQVGIYYNSDTTASNYWRQLSTALGTTVAGNRANLAVVTAAEALNNTEAYFEIVRDRGNIPRVCGCANRANAGNIIYQAFIHQWTNTNNVTSITLQVDVANSIGVGSFVKIFKVTS